MHLIFLFAQTGFDVRLSQSQELHLALFLFGKSFIFIPEFFIIEIKKALISSPYHQSDNI